MIMRSNGWQWLCGAALLALAACGGGGESADAAPNQPDAKPATGTISLTWSLTDGAGAITCDDVKATSVVVTWTPTSGGPSDQNFFDCHSGTGMTAVPVGNYTVQIDLKAGPNQVQSTVTKNNVAVTAGTDTPLGDVSFTVSRKGGFKFKLDVSTTSGTNCDPEGGNPPGAGITSMQITLTKGGTCVPGSFMVEAGAMGDPAQTIDAACPGGGTGACIENDQQVTVMGLDAGDYVMTIEGLEAANNCYKVISNISVAGGDVIKDQNTISIGADPNASMNCMLP
jgi:hypothetical protein